MVQGKCRSVLIIWIIVIVGHGFTPLALDAGSVVWTFFLSSIFSLFIPISGRRPDTD